MSYSSADDVPQEDDSLEELERRVASIGPVRGGWPDDILNGEFGPLILQGVRVACSLEMEYFADGADRETRRALAHKTFKNDDDLAEMCKEINGVMGVEDEMFMFGWRCLDVYAMIAQVTEEPTRPGVAGIPRVILQAFRQGMNMDTWTPPRFSDRRTAAIEKLLYAAAGSRSTSEMERLVRQELHNRAALVQIMEKYFLLHRGVRSLCGGLRTAYMRMMDLKRRPQGPPEDQQAGAGYHRPM